MSKRPIAVWLVFLYSLFIAAGAVLAAINVGVAKLGGWAGLTVSLIPATSVLIGGVSLFMLKRWSVWFIGLSLLIISSFFLSSGLDDLGVWVSFVVAAAILIYSVWLRRSGILV